MTDETKKEAAKKRMTPAQWAEARAMWASGEFTLEQLADKFGVARETLSRRFKKDGVKKGQAAIDKKVEAEIVEKATLEADKWRERAEKAREQFFRATEMLNGMNIKVLRDAHANETIFAAQPDLKAIQMCLKNLEMAKGIQWSILGLDREGVDEEEIPELMIRELTPDELQRIQAAQSQVSQEDEIEIGDAAPYLEDDDLELEDDLVVEGDD